MKLNLNDKCTVKLLPRGIDAIYKHYHELGIEPPKYAVGDKYTASLWDIMNVFGQFTFMGPPPPFETTIEIDKT